MPQADEVAQCSPRVTTVEELVIGSFLFLVHEDTNLGCVRNHVWLGKGSLGRSEIAIQDAFDLTYVNRNMSNIGRIDGGVNNLEISTDSLLFLIIPIQDLVCVGLIIELDTFQSSVGGVHIRAAEDEIHGIGHEVTDDSAARAEVVLVVGDELYRDVCWFGDATSGVVKVCVDACGVP